MANVDVIAFNIAAFICGLFVLEFGADTFIDHTAIVARRTGISQSLIGLLTAGAEWEELVVVIASIARNRSSLAIGNVIGSAISNILGAFSLGLLFHSTRQEIVFDRSAKIYSLLLLALTGFVTLLSLLGTRGTWKVFGAILLALFFVYFVSVAWAISHGAITAPELSDSDDDDDDDDDGDSGNEDNGRHPNGVIESENTPLLDPEAASTAISISSSSATRQRPQYDPLPHRLSYHIAFLLLGFLSICLAGYVLSHTSTTISDSFGTSDVLFGIVILSIATTLPEKFIAVLSGVRGHAGILVANTVGSNIFLLSLCMGVVLVVSAGEFDGGSVNAAELGVMLGATVALTATVWIGARWSRWIGAGMLAAYVVFLVLEFTVLRKIG